MKKYLSKTLVMLMTLLWTLAAPLLAWAAEHNIIILHTNDIHCGIRDNLGFGGLAQIKKDTLAQTPNVALVDAGDAIQGAPIGKLSEGLAVVNIMNAVGYDFCIPGNHEFDYGMQRFLELAPLQHAGYYSANFVDAKGKNVLPAYKIMDFEGTKVAFIGATTPATLISSTPDFFQDGKGNYIYAFNEDKNGKKLYKQLQKNINAVRKQGAEYVFIVGHLGMDGSLPKWNSESIAKNTTGVDGVIDGHSHEKFERVVQNKKGKNVLIAQTGTKLASVGQITITPEGKINTQLITQASGKDAAVEQVISKEMQTYEPLLKQPVGATLVQLRSYDPTSGERLVRKQECSLADFVTDAYKAVLDCDVVLVNGGAIRNEIKAGVITYNDILEAFPFGNMTVVLEATGQQIMDALEMAASKYPEENGAFLQVAGLSYTINSAIAPNIECDEKGNFLRVAGERRVQDVLIAGQPIELDKVYTVGGISYNLKKGGDGMTMFAGCKVLRDEDLSDADAIMEYIQNHLNGKIGEQYANPYGEGRITIK